ncbi:hypothetical protein SDC9_173544 [bioreactor metagenome]|uniref:Uncharacterized protein n=1 Tax=bioreactor metagenome TaxID=1076179 RepID=A0A645GIZ1_9ZZZZ
MLFLDGAEPLQQCRRGLLDRGLERATDAPVLEPGPAAVDRDRAPRGDQRRGVGQQRGEAEHRALVAAAAVQCNDEGGADALGFGARPDGSGDPGHQGSSRWASVSGPGRD